MLDSLKTNKNKTIKPKYRFVVLNDSTFEEKFSLILSRMNVWIFLSTVAVILVVVTASAIVYTPLKYFIPGFGSYTDRGQLISLALRTDSLEDVLNARSIKIGNMEGVFLDSVNKAQQKPEKNEMSNVTKLLQTEPASGQELDLRKEVESIENFAIHNTKNKNVVNTQLRDYHFVVPVSGIPTDEFNGGGEHYGIDIAAKRGEAVKAVLDGTVIYTGFDVETGYSITIQHKDDLISVYKHNASLSKAIGSVVKAGDVIAAAGNTGTLSSGPHLHFELWYRGAAVNPKDFILF